MRMSREEQERVMVQIAQGCRERASALHLVGKKRDDMALHYFTGARMLALALGRGEISDNLSSDIGRIVVHGWTHVEFILAHS